MKEIEAQKQTKAMNDKILMGAYSSRRGPMRDYKVGSEDLLEIAVFEDEKLNKTVRVSSQGNISLPLLGILRVKGLTGIGGGEGDQGPSGRKILSGPPCDRLYQRVPKPANLGPGRG